MAVTERSTRLVGNPGKLRGAFGGGSRSGTKSNYARSKSRKPNPGQILGFTLGAAGNPGRKAKMAQAKKKTNKGHAKKGYGLSKYKPNPGHKAAGHHHSKSRYKRHNPGGLAGLGGSVTNALFVIVGALGSKLGTQAILGTKNTGLLGYAGNAAAGGLLWFVTSKFMRNKAASDGVIAGTIVQILLRVINDYTPFGSYVAQLGMGDYQMQSFVTPQVLVDPWNSAEIAIPSAWRPPTPPMLAAAPGAGAGAGSGVSGIQGGLYGGRGGSLYDLVAA